jgi:hypothetical protein
MLGVAMLMPAIAVAHKGIMGCYPAIVMSTDATQDGGNKAQTPVALDAGDVNRPAAVTGPEPGRAPQRSAAFQNFPNPFNPSTRIQYNLESAVRVSLKVYNLLGQEVATPVNRRQEAGRYTVPFTAFNLSSGVYFYRLEAGPLVSTRRLILVK